MINHPEMKIFHKYERIHTSPRDFKSLLSWITSNVKKMIEIPPTILPPLVFFSVVLGVLAKSLSNSKGTFRHCTPHKWATNVM